MASDSRRPSDGPTPPTYNRSRRLFRLRHRFRVLMVGPGALTVGRRSTCDIVLQDGQISREHARIIVGDQSAAIEDLKSINGVLVNGKQVHGIHRLNPGDKIQIGNETVEVIGFSEPQAIDDDDVTFIGKGAVPRDWDEDPERPTVVKTPDRR
jgi:pSer/pThr/pTyr-binding forkhead associated (FHA) protein